MNSATRGTLFLVVGPSGVGKDSLLDGARAVLRDDPDFVFPRRVITRAADAGGEDHVAISEDAFDDAVRNDAFVLHWDAHGYRYGIERTVEDDLRQGRNVVVNVSRGAIDAARRRLSPVAVVYVTVSPDVLERRLRARGRETEREIARRLDRAAAYAIPDTADTVVLHNDRGLRESVDDFVGHLRAARHGNAATAAG